MTNKRQEGTRGSHRNSRVTNAEAQPVTEKKKLKEIFYRASDKADAVCPVRDIITRFSDKWSMLAVLLLGASGTLRFTEIRRQIGDVSQRMLTVTLRHLEEDGFLTRTVYAEVPPRVEYELTPLGYELMKQITVLTDWIDGNRAVILAARKRKKVARILANGQASR